MWTFRFRIHIGTGQDECFDYFHIARPWRMPQCGLPLFIPCIYIRALSQQRSNLLGISLRDSFVQRRPMVTGEEEC